MAARVGSGLAVHVPSGECYVFTPTAVILLDRDVLASYEPILRNYRNVPCPKEGPRPVRGEVIRIDA